VNQGKELSPELRALLAFLLSMGVLIVWGIFFKPPAPKPPAPPPAAKTETAPASAPAAPPPEVVLDTPAKLPVRQAAEEKTIVVENDLYRVEFSNRGGVVRRWELKKYRDDHKPQRTLDVVHPEAAAALGGWPLAIALEDAQLEARVNEALFEVTPAGPLRAPAEVMFEWGDGRVHVSKRLKFVSSYVVEVETSALLDGQPLAHGIAWRGGFGDDTVYGAAEQVRVFYHTQGKIQTLEHKKLGTPDRRDTRILEPGTVNYTGIEDRYFAAAFLPRANQPLALWHWRLEHEQAQENGTSVKLPVAEMAAGTLTPGPLTVRLFVGPKDLEVLGSLNPPLSELVQFGWFGIIARPLFYFLKWIYGYLPNYGWAIVLMTVIINMLLFPLKIVSWRSMQKMQKVMPEIKSIQERYKKYSMRDPRRQQMQQEIMAVYKREGVNPMGGCLPMLLQMPIWIGLYQMLNAAIELRHAPWFGWIQDLSARDPYYILPVMMGVTMYVMQAMTPVTTADPAQQRMMKMMPIMFGGMFIIIPISSGLVLYILTSNVVGMAQQWYLNRSAPAAAPAGAPHGKKKKKSAV
jgi:YidC/Oxa1 family membrane protein insertase